MAVVPSNRSSRLYPPDGPAVDSRARDTGDAATRAESSSLRLHYVRTSDGSLPAGEVPLAEICFGAGAGVSSGPHPSIHLTMEELGGASTAELWTSRMPVEYGDANGICFAMNGDVLFGLVSERCVVASAEFERRVHDVYKNIFALMEARGYRHLLRMWNFFPGINEHHEGLENYQRFCRGRALAFQEHYQNFVDRLPSASAVGTQGDALALAFIAARTPGTHRENPRQVSAYSYPPQYGPRSPSFARATLTRADTQETFYISGTASIVGHESLHVGDVRAQLEETFRNIEALIESTRRDEGTRFAGLRDLSHLKVYLRRAGDLDVAREAIERRIGAGVQAIYLVGDICRHDLLVEIEAVIATDRDG